MKINTVEKNFGPKEIEVISRLSYEKISIITKEQFYKLFKFNSGLQKQVVFRLMRKGILTSIKRGIYFYSPLESGPAGRNINEYIIPSVFFPKENYYIGYSTMYNYYGFTDQIFQVIYILNTSLQRDKIINGIRYKMLKISSKKMYGISKIKINDIEVLVSDREKTLVDLIYFPEPVGGLKNAFEILKNQIERKKINVKKLIKYTLKFPNISVKKRIGYFLEQIGFDDFELSSLLRDIKKSSLNTLYPSKSRKGKIIKKWMVIDNAS